MDTLEFHYQILELSRQATPQEIKASYRRLIKQWHPDQFVGDPNTAEIAEEKVKQINLAYDAITASQHKFGTVASRRSRSEARSPKASIQTTHLDPISLYQQASEQVNQGDYRSATESLSIAIKLEPHYAEAYRYRGFIYSLLGYERRAKSDLKKAAALKLQASMQFQTEEAPTSSPSPKQSPPVQNSYSTRSRSKSMPKSTEEYGEGQILTGHEDAITGLARHRKTLASCSRDG